MKRAATRSVSLQGGAVRRSYGSAGKDIKFGADVRGRMLDGVQRLTKTVQTTLGPKGRNVIIQQAYGPAKITKDGVTVAKAIEFKDPWENLGAQLVRQVASATNDTAGDGTTTSTVLAHAIFAEANKHVIQGRSPIEMKRGIDRAVTLIVEQLAKQSRDISSESEICQVATISANGDEEIGKLISTAMQHVGKEGVITTADGKTLNTELEVVEGMSLDRGYISQYFVTDTKTSKVEFENAYVLLCRQKISNVTSLVALLNRMLKGGDKPLLIVAEDVEGEALAMLILNKLQGRVRVAAVKAPGFGDNRTNILQDLAVFTGGQLVDEEAGRKLGGEESFEWLGTAKKVTITKEQAILLGGGGDRTAIESRAEFIRGAMEHTSSDYEKEKMQERLAKLTGGVAVIRVGGASEVEVGEKKDRVTDALHATRCAVKDGIVAGGGAALLHASKALPELLQKGDLTDDQKVGVRVVYEALRLPAKTIAENAGIEGSVVVHEVLAQSNPAMGYDANNDKVVNMFDAGIIDPTKVVRTALIDAASVAGLIMTTQAAITDLPKKDEPAAGGMGGMGGMGGEMF